MIDFIKLYWQDKSKFEPHISNKSNFNSLYSVLDQHSGEIQYPHTTNIENMSVVASEKSGYVKGSIHKLYNILRSSEAHNYNDFTYSRMSHTIDYMASKLVDIKSAGITQMEFGLNISTPIPAESIINRNVLMHQFKGYNHNKEYYGQGKLKQFDHKYYVLKIYDKAKQFKQPNNILRYEIKFLSRYEVQRSGIYCLFDLKAKKNLRRLFLVLQSRFKEMVIVDDILPHHGIPKADRDELTIYLNPLFWEQDLLGAHPQKRSRYRSKFITLLEKYRLLETKKALYNALNTKFTHLINH